MSGVPVFLRGRRHLRRRAAAATAALVGGAIVTFGAVRAFDGPDTTVVDEIDGRTWLTTSGTDGPVLVLANGISGLVEGQVGGLELRSSDVAFGGSDARHTLLTTPDQAVLLADGQQTAATFTTDSGARSVIAGAGVVTVGNQVVVRRIVGDAALADPAVVPVDGRPVPGAAPVVDAEGRAWVLVDTTAGRRRVQPILVDGGAGTAHDASDVSALGVVDGRAMVRTATAMRPVDGGDTLAVPGRAGVTPAVAATTNGTWAVADGARLAVSGPAAGTVDLPTPVSALAVWHGRVWAATGGELVTVIDGRAERIDGVTGRARFFADGGRLWFVTPDVAAAIDREQQVTVFALTSVDLSLCVGDCSAGDLTRALDDLPATTTTRPPDVASPPTTAPPISPPAVLPTLPSTTTTAPTTTEAPPTPPTVSVAATAGTTPAATVTVAATAPAVAETVAPETIPIAPPPTEPPATPPATPPRTSPPKAVPPTEPPTEPPTTTQPPLPPGQLVLGVDGGAGRATATYGFDGVGEQCAGADGAHTSGELSWTGGADGSELVELDLTGGAARGSREFSGLPPGDLTVTFRVCGEVGSATAVIEPDGNRPRVGAISFDPPAPIAGQAVRASATLDVPPGWLCASVTWVVDGVPEGSRCRGSTASHDLADLAEGTHEVQVIVSFTRLIESTDATATGSVTVTATTTPDSSTSVPDSDPPTASSDPPTSSSDPPTSSSDPPTSSSDPPTSSSDPPPSSSDPPPSSSDPPTSSGPPASGDPSTPPPA